MYLCNWDTFKCYCRRSNTQSPFYSKKAKKKTVLDIDFRPNLWGLSDHNDERIIESRHVTKKLKTLKLFDLIVETEEEFHIAGGINTL